jgi:hypothetical protein
MNGWTMAMTMTMQDGLQQMLPRRAMGEQTGDPQHGIIGRYTAADEGTLRSLYLFVPFRTIFVHARLHRAPRGTQPDHHSARRTTTSTTSSLLRRCGNSSSYMYCCRGQDVHSRAAARGGTVPASAKHFPRQKRRCAPASSPDFSSFWKAPFWVNMQHRDR